MVEMVEETGSLFVQFTALAFAVTLSCLTTATYSAYAAAAKRKNCEHEGKFNRLPTKIEIVPSKAPAAGSEESADEDPAGSVFFIFENGEREQITKGDVATLAKLGSDGLLGWTFGWERYRDTLVNSVLRVQRGHKLLFQKKASLPFIEAWIFLPEGIAVKSRAARGPAHIELFSLTDGRRLQLITKAYSVEGKPFKPKWAVPFLD